MGGHFGAEKTYERISRKYRWKGMKKQIEEYVKKCETCQKTKYGGGIKMPLTIVEVAEKPFEKIYIDLVGPLPVSIGGNKYILSMVDDLTRFVEFAAIPDATAETVARALFEQILFRYAIPRIIVSDNGTNFISKVFYKLCKLLRIKKINTTPYHPQANLVERQHSSLGNYLRSFAKDQSTSWDQFLRTAAHAYNNTKHSGTGKTPMEMLFGFVSEKPSNLKRDPAPLYNHDSYCEELRFKMQKCHLEAKRHLLQRKVSSKTYYDKSANPTRFEIGDRVLLKDPVRRSKLAPIWLGPFVVCQINGETNTTIRQNGKLKIIHNNRLKHYHD